MQADIEYLMALLFTDADVRKRFLLNPKEVAGQHKLSPEECRAVETISIPGLQTAAQSYERKRDLKRGQGKLAWLRRLLG